MSEAIALILIDVQKGLDELHFGNRNNPDAEANMLKLLQLSRQEHATVLHVKHNSTESESPLRPDAPGNAIKDAFMPEGDEPLFEKTVNSAFIGTGLEQYLHKHQIQSLLMVGLTTDHCVSTSVRMAENLGFKVYLVGDATATFDRTGPDGSYFTADQMHEANLASLHSEFCSVISTVEAAGLLVAINEA